MAAQTVKEEILKKISGRQVQTPEVIKKAVPPWMKGASVVGYVKRQLDKQQDGEGQSVEESRSPSSNGLRSLTPHEEALEAFRGELESWQGKSFAKVLRKINGEPVYKVGWCVLLGVEGFLIHPRIEVPYTSIYSVPCTKEPVIPEVDGAIERAIEKAFSGTKASWMEVLSDEKQSLPDQRGGYGVPHPEVLKWLADAVGVKLSAMPVWTSVQPSPPSESVMETAAA